MTAADRPDDGNEEGRGFKVFDRRHWVEDGGDEEAGAARAEQPTYVGQLEAQLAEKDQQLREYIAAYKREVVEELEATKARLQRDAQQQLKRERARVAGPMFEVFEALERSVLAAEGASDADALVQGVKMVLMLMQQKLAEIGLERVLCVGEPFDPARHEAVGVVAVDDAAQDNVVVRELSPGFLQDGRLVRAAKVQVGRTS